MVTNFRPYANALFEIAQEQSREQEYLDQLRELETVWKSNPDFAMALSHPKIEKKKKKEWIAEIVADQVDPLILNFLYVMNDHGLAAFVPQIADEYQTLYRENEGIEEVFVQSAVELSQTQIDALSKMLKEKLKKKIELNVEVDPDLIAGLKVRAKDLVLDNTVKSRLDSLKEKLIEK